MRRRSSCAYAKAIGGGWLSLYFSSLLATYAALLFADVQLSLFVETAATSRDAATQHLLVYLATALGHVALIVVASVSFAFGCVRASRSLHRNVVAKLMHAPLSWYDSTPSGRTMSRFTTDVSQVDLQLSLELDNTFQMSSSLLMLCGLVAVVARPLDGAGAGDPRSGACSPRDRPNNREVKRLSNNAVSPVLSSVYESSSARQSCARWASPSSSAGMDRAVGVARIPLRVAMGQHVRRTSRSCCAACARSTLWRRARSAGRAGALRSRTC